MLQFPTTTEQFSLEVEQSVLGGLMFDKLLRQKEGAYNNRRSATEIAAIEDALILSRNLSILA